MAINAFWYFPLIRRSLSGSYVYDYGIKSRDSFSRPANIAEEMLRDPAALSVWLYEPGQLNFYNNRRVGYDIRLIYWRLIYWCILSYWNCVLFHLYCCLRKFVYTDFVKYFVFPFSIDMIRALSKMLMNSKGKQILQRECLCYIYV